MLKAMFGALRPTCLEGGSQSLYRSSFCGSCHAMAGVGRAYSLATSYDIAFLHLVLAALEEAPTRSAPCTALPFRMVAVRQLSPRSERWLAAVNLLLMQAKCRDDVADDDSWKAKLGLRVLSPKSAWAEEVLAETGFDLDAVCGLPERQAEAERRCSVLEELAMPTSVLLGEVFAHLAVLSDRPEVRVPLRHLGQGLGMAIYLKDAREDRVKDQKRGRFNAVSACQAEDPTVAAVLLRELSRARHGLEGLPLGVQAAPLRSALRALLPGESSPAAPAWPAPSRTDAMSSVRRRQRTSGVCEVFLGCLAWAGCECFLHGCFQAVCDPICNSGKKDIAAPPPPPVPSPAKVSQLLCPACGEKMALYTWDGVEMDECTVCQGLWLDQGELEALAAMSQPPKRLLRTRPALMERASTGKAQLRPEGTRPCPRCAQYLTVMTVKGTRLDMCHECHGLFLDQGELNTLLRS
jgi:Zn-finger nucleic acid-binding protein